MRLIKRSSSEILKEKAHGGAGARKLLAGVSTIGPEKLDAITHGYLPAGGVFDWHNHEGIDEVMYVLEGEGSVSDEDGEYAYADGDVFIFPAGVMHRIENASDRTHEMIFVRIEL